MNNKKVGRNDICPCGSNKKYKKCCLENDQQKLKYMLAEEQRELYGDDDDHCGCGSSHHEGHH